MTGRGIEAGDEMAKVTSLREGGVVFTRRRPERVRVKAKACWCGVRPTLFSAKVPVLADILRG